LQLLRKVRSVRTAATPAIVWGWPLVNAANRAISFSKAPMPGLLGGLVPVAFNRNVMLTNYVSPDQYGAGYFDLDKEPIVVQRWLGLSEHRFAFYKWKLYRVGL
jgi:hypothetical protein